MPVFRRNLDSITVEEARQLASQEGKTWLAEDLIQPWSILEIVLGSALLLIGFMTESGTSSEYRADPLIALGLGFFLIVSVIVKSSIHVFQYLDKVRQVEYSKKFLAKDGSSRPKAPRISLANSLQDPVVPNCNGTDLTLSRRLPRISTSSSFEAVPTPECHVPDHNNKDQHNTLPPPASSRFVVSPSSLNVSLSSSTPLNQELDTGSSSQSALFSNSPRPQRIIEGERLELLRRASG